MHVTFNDFYGQYVTIHNETASGNIRLEVRTTENMNDVKLTKKEDCKVVTDLSLSEGQVDILFGALKSMREF